MFQVDPAKLKKAIKQIMFNQSVIGIPLALIGTAVMQWRGCVFIGELPTFHWVLFEIAIFSLVEEVMFYYSHR